MINTKHSGSIRRCSADHRSQPRRTRRVHARLGAPHLSQNVVLVGRQGQRDGATQGQGGEEDTAPPGQARGSVCAEQQLLRAPHRRRCGQGLVPAARTARAHCRDWTHCPQWQSRALSGRTLRAPGSQLQGRQRPQPPAAKPAQHVCARAEPQTPGSE